MRPEWQNVLTPEDKRALNVLFQSYINPYGLFLLDLGKRLGIMEDDSANQQVETTIEEEEGLVELMFN